MDVALTCLGWVLPAVLLVCGVVSVVSALLR